MKSAPKAFKRDGLEIFNFEGEKLGSIYPEYFKLYEIIDNANTNWKSWTKTERYNFLDELVGLNPNTLKMFWVYIKEENLIKLLEEWSK